MEASSATAERGWAARRPAWLLGVVPLVLIALAVGLFAALGAPGLGERRGPPVEELAVERTVLEPGVIELSLRNDGPDPVTVAQVVVNDAFAAFEGGEAADRPPRRRDAPDPRIPGSRARPTRSPSSPRPARRSPTRSPSRSRRRTPTSRSSG